MDPITKPSYKHGNRKPHNWLVYAQIDQFLLDHSKLIKVCVYDLGCGEMPYRDWILQFADNYVGVDWSSSLHELKADIVADLNEPLPIEDQVADMVVSFSVLEHLREPQTMLNEAYRILKPDGSMILEVPFMWWVHEAPWDFFRFTHYGLEHLFTKAGFIDIKIKASSGFWTMWLLKFNYQTLRLIRGPRPLRWLIKGALTPFWWLNQTIAPLLDRHWSSENETVGYFVTARKP